MRKLTIEEKAKRYDEAIERAKNHYSTTDSSSDIKLIGLIFPELKESEDEKIRQALIRFHKSTIDVDGIKGDKIISWLEKQGEHANFRNKIQVGDKVTRNEDGVLVNLSQLKRVAKPAEEYNITGIGSKNAQGKLGEMIKRKLEIEKQGEQKPAWSEEDENTIKFLISHFCTYHPTRTFQFTINEVITHDELLRKIRHLKHQNTWKPSDEQMKALEKECMAHPDYELCRLLEQLKKLTE